VAVSSAERSRRARLLAAVWIVPSAFFLLVVWRVDHRYRIDPPPRLDAAARAAAMAPLREVLDGGPARTPDDPALGRHLRDGGPAVVQVWLDGAMRSRVEGHGDTIAAAIGDAATQLAADSRLAPLTNLERSHARIKVALVTARGPLLRDGDLLAGVVEELGDVDLALVGVHPGVDGVGARWDGGEVVVLPDDMIRAQLLDGTQPTALVPDLRVGIDFPDLEKALAKLAHLQPAAWDHLDRRYFRLRDDQFVEPPADQRDQPPIPLTRNLPPRPPLSVASLRGAAVAGGHYLATHVRADGRFDYELNLDTGQNSPDYNLPRHAGACYYLAQVYRITGDTSLRDPLERAFVQMQQLIDAGGCSGSTGDGKPFVCLVDRDDKLDQAIAQATRVAAATPTGTNQRRLRELQDRKSSALGSTALAVVALAEYELATHDQRFHQLMSGMAEFVLWMQRDDGSFRHRYVVPRAEADQDYRTLYFDGEAALAMARMFVVTGDDRFRASAERALDFLVGWYDFFVGGFIYGEEHWTCIAAEALWPAVAKTSYLDFCEGYARFLRLQQQRPGDLPSQEDLAGSYNPSPFVAPHNTPAGSRSEAMVSTYLLGVHLGRPSRVVRDQVLAAMHYLLGQQIRSENDYDVAAAAHGLGAMPKSPIERTVRIDYIQHTCSAMLRTSLFLADEGE